MCLLDRVLGAKEHPQESQESGSHCARTVIISDTVTDRFELTHAGCSFKILATARRNRITFGTQMNQHSSRSHALLCITVEGTDLATGSKTTGKKQVSLYGGSIGTDPCQYLQCVL